MKVAFVFITMMLIAGNCFSQDKLKAFFEKKVDTIVSDSKKEITHSFTVLIPKQPKFKNAKIDFATSSDAFSVPDADIFLPSQKAIVLDNESDTMKKVFNIKFLRSSPHDRMITLKLSGVDSNGKALTLYDSNIVYKIWISHYENDTLKDAVKNGYEFWLFTGTNLDLIDGIKARELYFKGSYLLNFKKNDEETRHWMYLTFGKNRYFSERDSLTRLRLHDVVLNPSKPDSIIIADGYYNTFRQTVTDNIFGSLDYLYKIENISSKKSSLFATAGFYVGLQTIKIKYENFNFITDTQTFKKKVDSNYMFQPQLVETRLRQFNYNVSVGLMHILSTNKINVKSQLLAGLNVFDYPYFTAVRNGNSLTSLKTERNIFLQLKIDATVLSPGISIGFEAFLRRGQVPLFNVNLTKVIDLQQLSALFGKLPTITGN